MAFDVEAAKAAGYTDQEIQQYLAASEKDKKYFERGDLSATPAPEARPTQEIDRTPERAMTAGGAAVAAAPWAAGAYGAGKVAGMIPKAVEAMRGAVPPAASAPAAAVAPRAAAQAAQQVVPKVAQAVGSSAVKDIAMQGLQRGAAGVQAAAGAVAPIVAKVGIPLSLATHSSDLNAGEDQWIEEQRRKRAAGALQPTIDR